MDSSSSDEPIKYAPNRLGIALIAAGLISLVLSVYAIYAMGHWQGIWVYIFVQSAEGQGTEFNLILPIFDGQRAEIAPMIEDPKIQPRTYGDGVYCWSKMKPLCGHLHRVPYSCADIK